MKFALPVLAAGLLIATMPSVASADRYDRGDRYRGHRSGHEYRHRDHDRSRFSISLGFSSGGYRDYSHASFGYSRGYGHYYPRARYYRAPVIVRERYVSPPPVVYYAPPPRVYYYDSCGPTYYRSSHYYYGR